MDRGRYGGGGGIGSWRVGGGAIRPCRCSGIGMGSDSKSVSGSVSGNSGVLLVGVVVVLVLDSVSGNVGGRCKDSGSAMGDESGIGICGGSSGR